MNDHDDVVRLRGEVEFDLHQAPRQERQLAALVELGFESEPGRGTHFHLDLPVDKGWIQGGSAAGGR